MNIEVLVQTNSDGRTIAQTYESRHIYQSAFVTIIPHTPQAGLTREMLSKSWAYTTAISQNSQVYVYKWLIHR